MVTRRDFLKTTSLAGSAFAVEMHTSILPSFFGPFVRKKRRPNIVLFYSDDHSRQDLGCYGSNEIHTPNIDGLAAEGIKLTDFCAGSSVSGPCRGSLLTGRYPQRNGLYENIRNNMVNYGHEYKELEYCFAPEMTQGLDVREVTIAQALKEGGYRTGIFGKWDSGRAPQFLPLQRGFDDFYGSSNTGIDYYTHERYGVPSMFRGKRIKEEGYATVLFKREALRFIEENKDDPFFLYVPFNAPHGASNLDDIQGAQAPDKYIKLYGDLLGTRRERYLAAITCMDDAIGATLKKLQELGLEENTLVIYTADQGAHDNAPLRGGKGTFYEGGIRTPFVAKWPNHIPAGTVSNEFCSAIDLFPTFLNIAQTNLPKNVFLDGYDISRVLTDQAPSMRNEHFWELRNKKAARVGTWKWVQERDERWVLSPDNETGELFDLSSDIEEQHNLATERPDIVKEMKRKWSNWMKKMAASEPRGPFYKAYFDKLGYGNGNYRLWE